MNEKSPVAATADGEDAQTNRMLANEQQLVRTLSARRRTKTASNKRQSMPSSLLSTRSRSTPSSNTNRASVLFSTLQVEEHRVRTAQLSGERYNSANDQQLVWNQLVDVEQLDIEDADLDLLTAFGKRLNNFTSLATLSVTWSMMKSIPGSWNTATFVSLRSLSLARNQLQSIDGLMAPSADGSRFPRLETLDLSGNMLVELPKTFGQTMSRLKQLNISGNQLKTLPPSIGYMTELRSLNCAGNHLSKLVLAVCELTSLVQLDISSNHLTELPYDFSKLSNLEDLCLSNNKLRTLPNTFAGLSCLRLLSLAHNRFDHVPIQLSALNCLEHLNLSSNRIVDVDCCFPALRNLLLNDNLLQTVPRGICHSTTLRQVSLERNKITRIPDDIKLLVELRTLTLTGNEAVSDVPENVIGELSSLKRLDLRSTGVRALSESFVEAQRRRRTWIDFETPSTEEQDDECDETS